MVLRSLLCTACLFAFTGSALADPAEPLVRRAALGAALSAGEGGAVTVGDVGSAILGLRQGDVLLQVDGKPVASPSEAVAAIGVNTGGETGHLRVRRDGRELDLAGPYPSQPVETYAHGVARYGATPFEGGLLRDIMVTPTGGATGPVVFFIQGYTCDTVEAPQDSSRQLLIDGLLARGISTYRIEKPQVGDSRGGPACADIDFATETRAFQAGYRTLVETIGVSPERIFILGHSLGGVEAPLVAAAGPAPRGVAVYGTVVRSWRDYMLDVIKYQGFMATRSDPAEGEAFGERFRPLLEKIYAGGQSPAQVAAANPGDAELLRALRWDGGDRLMGRHVAFWRQISDTPLIAAWRDTLAQVLAVYGEADFAAVDSEDHRLIVDVVNHYRPGTALFVSAPRTGHGMYLDGDPAEARVRNPATRAPFNADLVPLFADWIDAAMSAPPVPAAAPKKS